MLKGNCLALILALTSLMTISAPKADGQPSPSIKDSKRLVQHGQLDLSDWDFKQQPIVELHGEWGFYWDSWIDPKNPPPISEFQYVPGSWVVDPNRDRTGKATYRVLITLSSNAPTLIISQFFPATDFRIYANGQLLRSSGGDDGWGRQLTGKSWAPITLPTDVKQIDLVVYISNNYMFRPGLPYGISIGEQTTVQKQRSRFIAIQFAILVTIIAFGLYHIGLFFIRPKERSPLYFAIVCFLTCLHGIGMGGSFRWLFFENLNYLNGFRIFHLSWFLNIPAFMLFYNEVFPNRICRTATKYAFAISAIYCLYVLITPNLPNFMITIYQLFTICSAVMVVGFGVHAAAKKMPGARVFVLAIVMLLVGIVNDILVANATIQSINLAPIAVVLFIGFQAFMLSLRFSNAFSQVERDERKIRKLNDELQEKERARTVFFQNTSHELRTPLNGILGFLELLLVGKYGSLPQEVAIQILKIKGLSESLRDQVNTILDLAKSKKGELTLSNTQFDLNSCISDLKNHIESLRLSKPQIDVSVSHSWQEEEEPDFISDREKLITIVKNLINNAFKFTTDDPKNRIEIHFTHEKDQLSATIEDTGIGIAKSDFDKIFAEFYQVEDQASRSYEGIGLGLTMVKKLVDLLNGTIEFASEINQGSRFSITIPAADQADLYRTFRAEQVQEDPDSFDSDLIPPPSTVQPIQQKADIGTNSYRILVVDDNQVNCEVIGDILAGEGFQIEMAFNGAEALRKVRQATPHLILLDLMMPEVSGEDVLKELKADETLNVVPVILLTARASEQDRIYGLGLGADDYLAKPIVSQELILKVKNLLIRLDNIRYIESLDFQEKRQQIQDLLHAIHQKLKTLNSDLLASTPKLKTAVESIFDPIKLDASSKLELASSFFNEHLDDAKNSENEQTMVLDAANPRSAELLASIRKTLAGLDIQKTLREKIWHSVKTMNDQNLAEINAIFAICNHMIRLDRGHRLNKDIIKGLSNFLEQKDQETTTNLKASVDNAVSLILQNRKANQYFDIESSVDDLSVNIDRLNLNHISLKLIECALEQEESYTSQQVVKLKVSTESNGDKVKLIVERARDFNDRSSQLNRQSMQLTYLKRLAGKNHVSVQSYDNDCGHIVEVCFPKAG